MPDDFDNNLLRVISMFPSQISEQDLQPELRGTTEAEMSEDEARMQQELFRQQLTELGRDLAPGVGELRSAGRVVPEFQEGRPFSALLEALSAIPLLGGTVRAARGVERGISAADLISKIAQRAHEAGGFKKLSELRPAAKNEKLLADIEAQAERLRAQLPPLASRFKGAGAREASRAADKLVK